MSSSAYNIGWISGVSIVVLYGGAVLYLTSRVRGLNTKEDYLLASRALSPTRGAISIAAAWLWAPGLLISAQQAYDNGVAGLFWFMIGNGTTLAIFGLGVGKLRTAAPEGFTLSSHLGERFSPRVQRMYLIEMICLAVAAFAINTLAASIVLSLTPGVPRIYTAMALAGLAVAYSLRAGLRATVVAEVSKFVIVWAGLLVLVPWAVWRAGGLSVVASGLSGVSDKPLAIIGTAHSNAVFATFGAAAALGHLAGPWADNSFYQRAFAVDHRAVERSFFVGAVLFAIPPLLIGVLGFLAAGLDLPIPENSSDATGLHAIAFLLPRSAIFVFVLLVVAGLVGVLDSQLSSIASMAGHDLAADKGDATSIAFGRVSMVMLAFVGTLVTFIPGLRLFHIFLFFATLRASVWLPTILTLNRPASVDEPGLFWGVTAAATVSLPIYVWGQLAGQTSATLVATCLAAFGAPLLATTFRRLPRRASKQ